MENTGKGMAFLAGKKPFFIGKSTKRLKKKKLSCKIDSEFIEKENIKEENNDERKEKTAFGGVYFHWAGAGNPGRDGADENA